MVSTIWMPDTVAEASLPASRIWTRVMFTRFLEMMRETSRFRTMVTMPTSVSRGLSLIMTTR